MENHRRGETFVRRSRKGGRHEKSPTKSSWNAAKTTTMPCSAAAIGAAAIPTEAKYEKKPLKTAVPRFVINAWGRL